MQESTTCQDADTVDSHQLRRLKKEARDASQRPAVNDLQIYTVDNISSDYMVWGVTFIPSNISLYHGGKFNVVLTFPFDYPFKPPKIQFRTKIFHPNVDPENGNMYTDATGFGWSPVYTANTLLRSIVADLDVPLIRTWEVEVKTHEGDSITQEDSYVANKEAAELWSQDRDSFETRVAEWLVMYAVGED